MSYQDDYKDVRWQMKRDSIRLRDNYTCRYCNVMGGFVNTHHLIYRVGLSRGIPRRRITVSLRGLP